MTGRFDVLFGRSAGAGSLQSGQFAVAYPATPVAVDERDQVGARRLAGASTGEVDERRPLTGGEELIEFLRFDSERGGGVGVVVEQFAVVGPSGFGADTQGGSASG